jgi:serine/threonine protein kinase
VRVSTHPEKIDRFIINQILGRGAQAVIYLASDPDLGRKVAIKALQLHNGQRKQENVDQLLTEARTVRRLQHNNIVTIFDIGVVDHNPFLVLEYIEDQSLQKLIKTRLKFEKVIRIMRDVLNGVSAAYEQDIIHYDIKPANILIGGDGHPKVADFGLAQLTGAKRADEEALYGTPRYMAPEYIETRQHKTVSEVFSRGLVFY